VGYVFSLLARHPWKLKIDVGTNKFYCHFLRFLIEGRNYLHLRTWCPDVNILTRLLKRCGTIVFKTLPKMNAAGLTLY